MFGAKPLDETPAHRTRRVLTRLQLPARSTVVWPGIFAGFVVLGLVVFGLMLGQSASQIFQGYVDRLRQL